MVLLKWNALLKSVSVADHNLPAKAFLIDKEFKHGECPLKNKRTTSDAKLHLHSVNSLKVLVWKLESDFRASAFHRRTSHRRNELFQLLPLVGLFFPVPFQKPKRRHFRGASVRDHAPRHFVILPIRPD